MYSLSSSTEVNLAWVSVAVRTHTWSSPLSCGRAAAARQGPACLLAAQPSPAQPSAPPPTGSGSRRQLARLPSQAPRSEAPLVGVVPVNTSFVLETNGEAFSLALRVVSTAPTTPPAHRLLVCAAAVAAAVSGDSARGCWVMALAVPPPTPPPGVSTLLIPPAQPRGTQMTRGRRKPPGASACEAQTGAGVLVRSPPPTQGPPEACPERSVREAVLGRRVSPRRPAHEASLGLQTPPHLDKGSWRVSSSALRSSWVTQAGPK